ncbi:MAG: tetratricopeptide repeat protein [Clostridiaceae bacterium]|nr:tetratricopeptide repeat protein [Clostridiaceae bacterium]
MKADFDWSAILEDEQAILGILLGDLPMPELSTDADSLENRLLQMLQTIYMMMQGEFDAAETFIADSNQDQQPLVCYKLLAIWLDAETNNPRQAYEELNTWMRRRQTLHQSKRSRKEDSHRIYKLDDRLAGRWAPVLRLYLTTLLDEWTPAIIARYNRDRRTAAAAGTGDYVLQMMDLMLHMAKARQKRNLEEVLVITEAWNRLCEAYPAYGNNGEYMLDAVIGLESDNRLPEAMNWIERSLDLNPNQYDMLLVKARILKRNGDTNASLKVCDELIRRYPDDFSGYCLRSNAYFLLGRYDLAMKDAAQACEVAPDNPNSFMARAFVHMQLNHYETALQDFEQTLQRDPNCYDALRGKGKCLSMLGCDFEALASFNALRRTYPDDPDLYYELADVLFSAGYLEECEKVCQKCLKLDDTYVSAYVILGMIAIRRDEDDLAHGLLTRAVKLEPDNPFALNELAYLIHLEGDDDAALELVNRALSESEDYADAICNKGVILYYRSEFEQAAAAFDQTLKLMPDHVSAWIGRGNTLTQLCDFDEAQRCYDKALQLDPDSADACHGKAVLYRMLGLDDEVRKWQERALLLDPDIEDE